MMEFCFIDNNTPLGALTHKRIRAHALKGKNLGKTIPARGHRGQQSKKATEISDRTNFEIQDNICSNNRRMLLPKPSHPIFHHHPTNNLFSGHELSYFLDSDHNTASVRYLIHEFHHAVSQTLYPSSFCRTSQKVEVSWFILMMREPCVFHCALAMTSAHLSHLTDTSAKTHESMRHFTEAMRLLRHDLSSRTTPTISNLVVIVSLAIHANLNKTLTESRTHLLALKHFIDSKPGGLAALCQTQPEIGNKFRRADLHLALAAGTPTLFGPQSGPLPATLHIVPLPEAKRALVLPHPLSKTGKTLQACIMDVLALCSYCGDSQLDGFQYQDLVIGITQRLADYESILRTGPRVLLDRVCQHGFLAFMSSILHHGEQMPLCSVWLAETLRLEIGSFVDCAREGDDSEALQLWLLFVFGISVEWDDFFCDLLAFLALRIRILVDRFAMLSWEDVRRCLCRFAWIGEFHDEKGTMLWRIISGG